MLTLGISGSMGFPGAYGIVFPIAICRAATLLMFIKQSFASVVDFCLGRGWESPSSRMYALRETWALREPIEWMQADAPEIGYRSELDAATLAAEIKASLPVVRYGEVANKFVNDEDALCSVCLCDFTKDDGVRQAPRCSHVFHKDCLDRWMAQSQSTCPLCRSTLTVNCQPEERRRPFGARRSFLREYWDSFPSAFRGVYH